MGVNVITSNFVGKFSYINKALHNASISHADLLRGIITVGKSNWINVYSGGRPRIMEIQGLRYQFGAYIEIDSAGNLKTSPLYKSLDPSEKVGASYRLGMGMAKIVCELEMGIPWLRHIYPLVRQGIVSLSPGGTKSADLIGMDLLYNDWHVVEAKARSNRPPTSLFGNAKTQSCNITNINGLYPATQCISILDLSKIPLTCHLQDPQPEGKEGLMEITIDENGFFEYYYDIIKILFDLDIEYQELSLPKNLGKYVLFHLPNSDISIGLYGKLFDLVIEKPVKWIKMIKQICKKRGDIIRESSISQNFSLGLDGFAVEIGEDHITRKD